jgi:hypothetical protein
MLFQKSKQVLSAKQEAPIIYKGVVHDPKKPSPNEKEVHKNKYIFTLEELIKFTHNLYSVGENIIYIEPVKNDKKK